MKYSGFRRDVKRHVLTFSNSGQRQVTTCCTCAITSRKKSHVSNCRRQTGDICCLRCLIWQQQLHILEYLSTPFLTFLSANFANVFIAVISICNARAFCMLPFLAIIALQQAASFSGWAHIADGDWWLYLLSFSYKKGHNSSL